MQGGGGWVVGGGRDGGSDGWLKQPWKACCVDIVSVSGGENV